MLKLGGGYVILVSASRLKFSKQKLLSASGSVRTLNKQNQVNNGMNLIYLKPFLTFLKLKTAKNKSAVLSCR